MRTAKYLADEPSFVPVWDICRLLEHLKSIGLAAMNDPKVYVVDSRFGAVHEDGRGRRVRHRTNSCCGQPDGVSESGHRVREVVVTR